MSSTPQLNPNVSVDCVIFGFDFDELRVLLVDRSIPERAGQEAIREHLLLPGDLIRDDENLDQAAQRVLHELTGLKDIYLEQFRAFGAPDRASQPKDAAWLKAIRAKPEARVVTVAYYSLIKLADLSPSAGSAFRHATVWYPISEVPELGFDHNEILGAALESLKMKLRLQPIGFELLPKKFTLGQLQKLYESILGSAMDKRNFRRKILNKNILIPLSEKQKGVAHKPAQYFKFDKKRYEQLKSDNFYFEF